MPYSKDRTQYGRSGWRWQRIRDDVLKRDNYVCRWCGELATTADHVQARAFGGSDEESNLVACCRMCNKRRQHEQSVAGQKRAAELRARAPEPHPGRARGKTQW